MHDKESAKGLAAAFELIVWTFERHMAAAMVVMMAVLVGYAVWRAEIREAQIEQLHSDILACVRNAHASGR